MRCNRRGLALENVEHRIALSVNAATSPDLDGEFPNNDTRVHISLAASSVSEQAFIATDNSAATARDLGLLSGTVSLQNEYVGRFDPQDVYRFELDTQAYVSIDLRDLTADASLYLLDSSYNVISQSELGGTSPESLQLDLQAGEYFVVVNNHNQFSSANYTLDFVSSDTPPDGAGNTIETAFDLGQLSTSFAVEGHVGGEDTADFFAIQLSDSAYVKFTMTSLVADLDLYIYSDTGELLGGSNAANTSDEIAEGQLAAGTYFVSVVPYETAESSYDLLIENIDVSSPEDPGDGDSNGEDPGGEPDSGGGDNSGGGGDNSNESQPITIDPVPYFGTSLDWGVNSVDAPEAWNAGYTGNGVTIAVIDTGFQLDHVDLQDVFWVNSAEIEGDGVDNDGNGYVDDRIGWDFVQNDSNPTSSISNHATHVSGIIAANRNSTGGTGVAYASRIMPIRVLDDEGSGSTSDVAQGIRYAVDNGADIINLSLGGSSSSPTILSALQYAATNDVFVVAAAGNESAATTAYPARHSGSLTNVLSVGAHSSSNQLASFSNLVGSSNAVQVDAPGVSIYNTVIGNGYAYLSGTSMATPYVAGVAALTLSANPHLTSVDLREVLVQGATAQITNSDSIGAVRASNSIELGSTHGSTSDPEVPGGIGATSTISAEDLASEGLDPGVIQIQIEFHKPFVSFAHFNDSDNDSALDSITLETIALEHLTTFQADAFADVDFTPNDLLA